MPITHYRLATPYGELAISQTAETGFPIVMLHGSGASSSVFSNQFESPLAAHFRLIAIDLPGHGASDNFSDPDTSYTLPVMARTMNALLPQLRITRAVVLGWSLGGHLAIEMMAQAQDYFAGLMITGAPPIDAGIFATLRAFHLNPVSLLAGRAYLSHSAANRLAHMFYGALTSPALVDAILDTDPNFRPRMMGSIVRGDGANQRQIVETLPVPLAVIGSTDDPAIRASYLAGLRYANLWENKVHMVPDGRHAPFMTRPHIFNALLHRFATSAMIGLPLPQDASAVPRRA